MGLMVLEKVLKAFPQFKSMQALLCHDNQISNHLKTLMQLLTLPDDVLQEI